MSLYSQADFDKILAAGKIVADVHQLIRETAKAGVITRELDLMAESCIRKQGAKPSFKGYRGYPASICTSLNEEVVHGIPSDRILREGDLLKIDVGAYYHGFHADAGFSMGIGIVSSERLALMQVAEGAFYEAFTMVQIGKTLQQVGGAIERYVHEHGFSIVRQLVGHGVGKHLHEDPEVPNFDRGGVSEVIEAGMVLAIEPMVNAGTWKVKTLSDGWTVVTDDMKDSAYFEHTIIVAASGPKIATG
jgi:methionyl aminopeptidase